MIIFLYVLAIGLALAGANHFLNPGIYLKMMPSFLPAPALLVQLSGIAEIILGLGLLFPQVRIWSAWGIILLMIAIFPANIYMLSSGKFDGIIPQWILWARLPFQVVFIYWAYQYTKA